MKPLKFALAALAMTVALPAFAQDTITVKDAYARFMPGSMAGAAFMVIENAGDADDQLIDAKSDIADRVELHTHKADASGMMQMIHVPEGFAIPAHGDHSLQRGGDHVMLMGLKEKPENGQSFSLTLTFEKAGDVTVEVPVDMTK